MWRDNSKRLQSSDALVGNFLFKQFENLVTANLFLWNSHHSGLNHSHSHHIKTPNSRTEQFSTRPRSEKWTHFGKQNKSGVEKTLIWSKHQPKRTDGEECILKSLMKNESLNKILKIYWHKNLTFVRRYAFLTGHSWWNWSKAQQCQPIPLEHQNT